MSSSSPREVVEAYNLELWNKRRFELADELIAEQLVRHDVGAAHMLTRAQARQRIQDLCARFQDIQFTLLHLIADGEYVCIVYQCEIETLDGLPQAIASIEVFRVVDGQITEVWNNTHQDGWWR